MENQIVSKLNMPNISRKIHRIYQTLRVVIIFQMVRKHQTNCQQVRDGNQNQKAKLKWCSSQDILNLLGY